MRCTISTCRGHFADWETEIGSQWEGQGALFELTKGLVMGNDSSCLCLILNLSCLYVISAKGRGQTEMGVCNRLR